MALKNPALSYPWQDYDLYNVITINLLIKMNEPITLYFKYLYIVQSLVVNLVYIKCITIKPIMKINKNMAGSSLLYSLS